MQDVPGRQVDLSSPLLAAASITGGKAGALYQEGAEKHRAEVLVSQMGGSGRLALVATDTRVAVLYCGLSLQLLPPWQ